jgi:Glucodextranase, domain B
MAKDKKSPLYAVEWTVVSVRSIKIFFFVILSLTIFLIYWYWFREKLATPVEVPVLAKSTATARFIDYEGKVEVKPKDEFVWKPASLKMDLQEGDRVRTAPDSSARVNFEDGTEITIQSDSIAVLSRRSPGKQELSPLVVIEIGESDINAEKSASAPSLSTSKISRFKVAPGSTGTIRAELSGNHSGTITKGYGEITTVSGTREKLNDLEQFKVDQNNVATKTKLPYVPPLFSPQNGQVFEFLTDQGLTVELKWRDVSNAEKYHVEISESPLFGKLSAQNESLAKSSISIKIPKTSKKQYFWRVRSIDQKGNKSPWSDPFQFVVQSPRSSRSTQGMDRTPPPLDITYMHPFLPFVQVEGRTEPDAFLTLNGEIIDVREDGSFVYTYTLKKSGWNDLVFVAEDPAGNKATATKQVEY